MLNTGVCCFFPDARNGLSWAHYGCSHRGFTYALNTAKVAADELFLKVEYRESPPPIAGLQIVDSTAKQIIASKNICWEHEQEWRVFRSDEANLLDCQSDGEPWPIEKIYFGGRMTGEEKEQIRDETSGIKLDYYDIVFSPSDYAITYKPSRFRTTSLA